MSGFEPMIMHTSAVAGPWCSAIQTPMRPCAMVLPGWSIDVATQPRGFPSASRNAFVIGAVSALASPNVPLYSATASGPCSSTMRVKRRRDLVHRLFGRDRRERAVGLPGQGVQQAVGMACASPAGPGP